MYNKATQNLPKCLKNHLNPRSPRRITRALRGETTENRLTEAISHNERKNMSMKHSNYNKNNN